MTVNLWAVLYAINNILDTYMAEQGMGETAPSIPCFREKNIARAVDKTDLAE